MNRNCFVTFKCALSSSLCFNSDIMSQLLSFYSQSWVCCHSNISLSVNTDEVSR